MLIDKTPLDGVFVTSLQKFEDDRGFFARTYCGEEFKAAGVDFTIKQTNISGNIHKGTLRGLHYQGEPKADNKLVTCTRGAIFDVAVDLRPSSPTYCKWFGVELSAHNRKGLYIPRGCAHGFMTLEDDTDVNYLMGQSFVADLARGARWNDPTFAITWPHPPLIINERDASYADWQK